MAKNMLRLHESKEPKALALSDYPEGPFNQKLKGIIGFEIKISIWTACFRLNQNRTEEEREHIVSHLATNKSLSDVIKNYNTKNTKNLVLGYE